MTERPHGLAGYETQKRVSIFNADVSLEFLTLRLNSLGYCGEAVLNFAIQKRLYQIVLNTVYRADVKISLSPD
jgi:hypothetical protein